MPNRTDEGGAGGEEYVVEPGDCMSSIAESRGFWWSTLWELGENRELRESRGDPNVLQPRDVVFIPALREMVAEAETEAQHRYRRRGVPAKFRLKLLFAGKPRAKLKYGLKIEGVIHSGETGEDGMLEVPLSPKARSGRLTLYTEHGEEHYDLKFGGIDPITSVRGVQRRLVNLGIGCPSSGEMDEGTGGAIRSFRSKFGLEDSEGVDDAFRAKLLDVHGC
jgi:hypothetical protein